MAQNPKYQTFQADLKAVGMACFVDNFDLWTSTLTNQEAARKLQGRMGYTWNSCNSRTSKARKIIEMGYAQEAFRRAALSTRTAELQ